jgi:hypothetical protein
MVLYVKQNLRFVIFYVKHAFMHFDFPQEIRTYLFTVDYFRMLYLCIDLQMFSCLGRTSQGTRSFSIIVTKYVYVSRPSCTVSLFLSDLGQN